ADEGDAAHASRVRPVMEFTPRGPVVDLDPPQFGFSIEVLARYGEHFTVGRKCYAENFTAVSPQWFFRQPSTRQRRRIRHLALGPPIDLEQQRRDQEDGDRDRQGEKPSAAPASWAALRCL